MATILMTLNASSVIQVALFVPQLITVKDATTTATANNISQMASSAPIVVRQGHGPIQTPIVFTTTQGVKRVQLDVQTVPRIRFVAHVKLVMVLQEHCASYVSQSVPSVLQARMKHSAQGVTQGTSLIALQRARTLVQGFSMGMIVHRVILCAMLAMMHVRTVRES